MLVKDAPAFVVNRLLTRFLGEVTAAVDEGTPIEVADRALEPLGLPMSPFALLQLVGPASHCMSAETMHEAFPDRYGVSENLERLVAAGRTSVYVWRGRTAVDPAGGSAVPRRRLTVLGGAGPRSVPLMRWHEEIRLMLDEGVVAEVADIDLCMLLGAGWPFHLGGITPYLDRTGIAKRVMPSFQ